jgi:hypothetical protein
MITKCKPQCDYLDRYLIEAAKFLLLVDNLHVRCLPYVENDKFHGFH